MKKFYTDPYLHIRSFTLSAGAAIGLCIAARALHTAEFYQFTFSWWHLALIPLGIYAGGLSAVFIHNATHDSFPSRGLNRLAGELAGLHQLWGFMGWKLIHLVHHQYSDQVDMDVHPPKGLTFAQFSKTMFLYSSAKITERYREHWGTGTRTQILHRILLPVFLGMAGFNLLFWYLLLGPAGFLFFYIPSYAFNHWMFCDINYRAHPKGEQGVTAPANLDESLYDKLANFLWFGIYYHGNHHRRPLLFNPKKMVISRREPETEEREAA